MKAVAAGNEIAFEFAILTVMPIGDARALAGEVVQRDIVGFVDAARPGLGASLHQVAGDLGLAIDGDRFAGERLEIDAMAHPFDADLRSVVNQSIAVQAVADAGLLQELHRSLLDQTGANPFQHVVRRMPFENDIVDAMAVQKLPEQQARRAGADDRDLRAAAHSDAYLTQT